MMGMPHEDGVGPRERPRDGDLTWLESVEGGLKKAGSGHEGVNHHGGLLGPEHEANCAVMAEASRARRPYLAFVK